MAGEEFNSPIVSGQLDNLIYWASRTAQTQDALTGKTIEETERQLARYYSGAQRRIIAYFVATYQHALLRAEGGQVTPADLYRLSAYWEMQAQLEEELRRLNDKQAELLAKKFTDHYQGVYKALAIPSERAFKTISKGAAQQVINTVWCADGKSWSARLWGNTEALKAELNNSLTEIVTAGRKTTALKERLMENFEVSYNAADRVVRTETAHITTQAAIQRYTDSGIKQFQVWASPDERRCEICGELHEKKYPINYISPIPAHPNCRCTLIPVVDAELLAD